MTKPRYVATKDGYRDYRVWDRLQNRKCGAHHTNRRDAELEAQAMVLGTQTESIRGVGAMATHFAVTERNLQTGQVSNYYEPLIELLQETVKFAATCQPNRSIVCADIYADGHRHYSVAEDDTLLFTWDVDEETIS